MLMQSGALYNMGIVPFATWAPTKIGYAADIPATPMQSLNGEETIAGLSGPTRMTAQIGSRGFVAVMSGPKAANQEGGAIAYRGGPRGYVNLPARPFWFIDQEGTDQAAAYMVRSFLSRWVEKMPNPVGAANRVILSPTGVTQVSTFGQGLGPYEGP